MNPLRKRKITIIVSCLLVVAIGLALVLTSLSRNINLFVTPTQVVDGEAPLGRVIRVGGLVVEGSLRRGSGTRVFFSVTDTKNSISIDYDGILPDLFQEGQAVVVKGELNVTSVGTILLASEVLAKHDENYIPTEAAEAIMQAQKKQ